MKPRQLQLDAHSESDDSWSVEISSTGVKLMKVDLEVTSAGITNMATGVSLSINPTELELGQVIGQGSSGIVYAGRHIPSATLLAIKSINIYERERRRQLENDLKVLDGFNSPYLVRYYGAFFNEGTVKVVMELMDFGSLRRLMDFIGGRGLLPEHVVYAIALPVRSN
mmetsp:Transcript_7257/g.13439  ORF Transcript_7257/g.13439 Transcript_7257/m.13439 type:complete len:168 (+) Transcript_7257:212-715(+)